MEGMEETMEDMEFSMYSNALHVLHG